MLRICTLGAIALGVVATSAASAQDRQTLTRRLDSIAGAPVKDGRAVGMVAAVIRGNDTLLLQSYGKADVEWDAPMPVDALFETGSVAKQFTAVAILQLRDAGKLTLDDEVTKWLPDFNARGNRVTLRRLLDHTSGIHNFTDTPEFGTLVSHRFFPRDSAYVLINRTPFDFPTGEAQRYSNSGYFLLGMIVEKASGMTFEDYVEKLIFAQLGMSRSMTCNSLENVPHRAHGYGVQGKMIARAPNSVHTWTLGAGGICSTVADMLTWLKALHGGKVLSPASYTEMTSRSKLNDWIVLRYGMGLGVGPDGGGRHHFEHGGILAGFRTQLTWYPDTQTGIVVLVNNTGPLDPQDVAEDLADAILPRVLPNPFTGDPAPLLGSYKGRAAEREFAITVTTGPDGPLVSGNGSPPRPLTWVEGWTFLFNDIYLTFHRDGITGPAGLLGFSPAKGVYGVFGRIP
ncbi:MAG: serine hydrolase domain-containing protein [Gemmatimonadales bacterium]